VSFVVSHPFEESSYPKDMRTLWKAIPERAKDKIIEMGRKFGHHAMVEGAVPMTFDEGTSELIQPLLGGKYIQSIPEAFGGNPAKFWVDASLLNYSMLVDPPRAAKWKSVAILGTASCIVSNIGDGAAIDVDVTTGNEALGASARSSTIWVEPSQGIPVYFDQEVAEGAVLAISWTSESGERATAKLTLPAIVHTPIAKAGLRAVA
jgi:hypothetical protein